MTAQQRAKVYRRLAEQIAKNINSDWGLCRELTRVSLFREDRPEFNVFNDVFQKRYPGHWYWDSAFNSGSTNEFRVLALLFMEQMALDKSFQKWLTSKLKEEA